jgi:hypothetical protein
MIYFLNANKEVWPEAAAWSRFLINRYGFMTGFIGEYALIFSVISGAWLAWRWILGTFAAFAALVAVNEIYVRFLEPMTGSS